MNSMVTYNQSELARSPVPATHADVRPAFRAKYRLRQIAGDVAMLVAVLAFVLTFMALRFTLSAPPKVVERITAVAAGAAMVCVLALLGSFALRHGDAPGPTR